MRRFLIMFAASTLAWLAAIAFLPVTGLVMSDADVTWAASLYRDKDRAVQSARKPRVLAVGGSGTLFSLDTAELSRRLDRPVINYGSHAGLGLTYILDRAARALQPGDLVLLMPEHELLQESGEPTQLAIAMVAFYDRDYLVSRSWKEHARFLLGYGVLSSIAERFKVLAEGANGGRDDVHLDALGNERGNTVEAAGRIAMLNPSPVDPSRPISPNARQVLARFAATVREKKARLIILPPALLRGPSYDSSGYRAFARQEEMLFAALGLDYRGRFDTGFLPREDMYDSVYHANDRGRRRYTAKIAALVCGRMDCRN